jgi:2-amino-4-hydroxy-6-hydroxymethyldihydropteridine diphosphokinase
MGGVARQVAIALGSNLGERRAHIDTAVAALDKVVDGLRVSALIETDPVGTTGSQGPYLNGAAVGWSVLSARELLARLQAIECAAGRERPYRNAPRTLDLDLILLGEEIVEEPDLQVPHPRFRERRFVLEPLAAIAPDMRDPVTGLSVRDLLARLSSPA